MLSPVSAVTPSGRVLGENDRNESALVVATRTHMRGLTRDDPARIDGDVEELDGTHPDRCHLTILVGSGQRAAMNDR